MRGWAETAEEESAGARRRAHVERVYGTVVLRTHAGGTSVRLYRLEWGGPKPDYTIREGAYNVDGDAQGTLVGHVAEADVPTTREELADLWRRMAAATKAEDRRRLADQAKRVVKALECPGFLFDDRPFSFVIHRYDVSVLNETTHRQAKIQMSEDEIADGLAAREIVKRYREARRKSHEDSDVE